MLRMGSKSKPVTPEQELPIKPGITFMKIPPRLVPPSRNSPASASTLKLKLNVLKLLVNVMSGKDMIIRHEVFESQHSRWVWDFTTRNWFRYTAGGEVTAQGR